jgi:hypothetical protein
VSTCEAANFRQDHTVGWSNQTRKSLWQSVQRCGKRLRN